ncbi:TlpA disulfide reductase family protein [Pedobacter nyackensis]|uniref:peroxiredoxin family protein n=1 Tax=Pedobacter nyackensis TaxID=475255 RepID=UPI00292E1CC8|nr:TlpA disulfide reductase family protein [Pedobacter nyackensis]
MIKRTIFIALFVLSVKTLWAQKQPILNPGKWHASLLRTDGRHIPIQFEVKEESKKLAIYIVNGTERLKTEPILMAKDSAIIKMPVFESYFKVKFITKDSINGFWIRVAENKEIIMPFAASTKLKPSANVSQKVAVNIAGKWTIEFTRANQTKRPAIGQFVQNKNSVSGSILTPSGDYRYLNGTVSGDSFNLSTFDGIHAMLFEAKVEGDTIKGTLISGASGTETWIATRNEQAVLSATPLTTVKKGSNGIPDFQFKDLNGNDVSIKDERYRNKVVILQIMGSWCPNCMDETAFLSEYYRKNKHKGIEIIALAYELSTDNERSKKSLQKFQTRFDVQYPILLTGVTVSDPKKTEKTLPQLTDIKVFPTTVFIDKTGKISGVETNFFGPATGQHYLKYKEEFEKTVNLLLK